MINTSPLPYMNLLQGDFCYKVKGKNGATNFSLGANSRIPLFDEDNDIFFIKTTDANGEPTIRMYRFEEIKDDEYPEKYLTVEKFDDYMENLRKELLDAQLDIQHAVQSIANGNTTENAKHDPADNAGSANTNSQNKRRYGNNNH